MWTPLLCRTPTWLHKVCKFRIAWHPPCTVFKPSQLHIIGYCLLLRAGNVALPLLNTHWIHNVQGLNCLLTATAARLDQDTASLQLDKAFMRIYTCAGLVLLKLWFQKCQQQQQQLRSSHDYVLICQLAIIGSCHVKLLTASTNMTTIYLWLSYK